MNNVLSIVFNELTNDNRVINQAESLQQNGYKVTLLGIRIDTSLPLNQVSNGVNIIRVPLTYRNPLIYRTPFLRFYYRKLSFFYLPKNCIKQF